MRYHIMMRYHITMGYHIMMGCHIMMGYPIKQTSSPSKIIIIYNQNILEDCF
jgi:hypothetical protein